MPPRGRGRGGSSMGRTSAPSSGASQQHEEGNNGAAPQNTTGEEPKRAPILTSYQALQRKAIIPPLYPDVKIHKCKPITDSMHIMIDQMRNTRGRIRNSPYYIDSHHCEAALDEKKDPLLSSLGIKTGYFPSELVVRPNKKRLMMLYKRFNFGSEEANVQRLEKLFKQKDDFGDDDEDDENADNIFLDEQDEDSDGDAYDAFQNYDDDEDYLDEEEVGDADEGPTM